MDLVNPVPIEWVPIYLRHGFRSESEDVKGLRTIYNFQ